MHERFASSEYGQTLAANIRFGDFKPEETSNQLWEDLLGDDVNNLRHMPYTLEIAKRFILHERLGKAALLQNVAITHDWGEAVVGDVALPDKKLQGVDLAEVEAYRHIARELDFDDELEQVPEVLWGEHEMSEPFNVIEYIGYCETGLRAGRMACLLAGGVIRPEISRFETEKLLGGLLALNKQVELKNFPKLRNYEDKYPSIGRLMGFPAPKYAKNPHDMYWYL
jgi:hypothetical protein